MTKTVGLEVQTLLTYLDRAN